MALAHHMIVVIHQVLSRQEEYVEFGGDYYDRRNKLVMRLSRLGYQVDLKPVDSLAPAHFSMTEVAPPEASEKAIPKLEARGVRHVEDSGGGFGPCDFGDAGRGVRCWRRGRTGGTRWRAALVARLGARLVNGPSREPREENGGDQTHWVLIGGAGREL